MAKILLLEDNEVNRDMLIRRLQRRGYHVIFGCNGTEALPLTLAERPNLILMDMSMPEMDGWQATQQLKAEPQTQDIPVIALTAHAMSGDREKALAAGCDNYETKPIAFDRLLEKIEALLPAVSEYEVALNHQGAPGQEPAASLEGSSNRTDEAGKTTHLVVDEHVERLLLRHLRHELCTPINAIIGYSEILLEELPEPINADLRQDLEKVYAAGLQLLEAANAILNPAQLENHPVAQDIDSFSSRVRVELLTPLSTVMGYCEMMVEQAPAAVASDLNRIDKAARQLLSMVNDIVNLAQQQLQAIANQTSMTRNLSLNQTVDRVFAQTAAKLMGSFKEAESQVIEGNILVVDDNTTNCDLLSRQLERQGYTVSVVNSGSQALQSIEEVGYDLVLLDIFMPDMNGFDVLARIKQNPDWQTMPVIMISALDELNSVVSCIEMGAEDYLPKPFNPILLRAKINACLEKKRLQDQRVIYLAQRIVAEATPIPILIARTEDGRILYANSAAGQAIGLTVADLLHHQIVDFYLDPSTYQTQISTLSKQSAVYRQEMQCKRASGEPFWVAASMQPLTFEGESTILAALYDISDRKQAENALRIAEENYRSIFEHARSGIYQSTPDGTFLRVNTAMATIHGYESPQDMMDTVTNIREQIYVDANKQDEFQRLIREQGQVSGFEYQARQKNGEVIWVSENARMVADPQGQLLYCEGILEDITQRKLTEAALKREVQELRIEIDEARRAQAVAEITESAYFREIQAEAEELRFSFDEALDTLQPPTPKRTTPKILLVEDNELNRDMLTRRLRKAGYDIVIAVNGQEGVVKTTEEQPDIVLMDLSLPIMDGWTATQKLKADPQTQRIPVIALTAHATPQDREKALAAGCDEYDTKPIDWARLLGKVEAFLQREG